ncbi:MAG: hypothetical protein U9O41_02990 [Candidatus Aerophobetes bacterium]|nr:hypothetical protein [Candidatus Aerophobetes bacterium]
MRSLVKIKISIGTAAAIVIAIFLINGARSETINYQIGDLMVTFPQATDWQMIKADKNELILKIMTFEPVVRRYEFITHEIITVSCRTRTEAVANNKHIQHLSTGKAQLANVIGLLTQEFLWEGFEIGKGSSFIEVAGTDAYKFELIRPKIPREQWLKGKHIKYAWHIVIWKKSWYLITYCNFDNAFPGPHFFEFKMFLKELKSVGQNSN